MPNSLKMCRIQRDTQNWPLLNKIIFKMLTTFLLLTFTNVPKPKPISTTFQAGTGLANNTKPTILQVQHKQTELYKYNVILVQMPGSTT